MKNALILGADGHLGGEIVKTLLKKDFTITGTTITNQSEDPKVKLLKMDISDKKDIDRTIETIKDQKFDVFTSTIANKLIFNKFELIPDTDFEKDIQINILNHIYFLKKIIPLMKKGSCITFILTTFVETASPKYCSSYAASKYYLLGIMKALSEELKAKGIRVNAVSPGMMDTAFSNAFPDMVKKIYLQQHKQFTNPQDVAAKFVEIAEDESLNGENIIIE